MMTKKLMISVMFSMLVFSCSNDIPVQTHELLHGVWVRQGFMERLAQLYSVDAVLDSFNDSIEYLIVDPLYNSLDRDSTLIPEEISSPEIIEYSENGDSTIIPALMTRGLINEDSLTLEERDYSQSIWVVEICSKDRIHPHRLYYQGNGYFESTGSDESGTKLFLKIIDKKNMLIEYGRCDDHGNAKSSANYYLFDHGGRWYSERYKWGWETDLNDNTLSKYWKLIEEQSMRNVKSIECYQRINDNKDSLISVYSLKDIKQYRGISISLADQITEIDAISKVLIPSNLLPSMDYRDNRYLNDVLDFTIKNDTAYIGSTHPRLHGTYFLVIQHK